MPPAMPTPVSTARQCLTDEAARALDDAVAVARRRSHSQTTSLHAVSSLLSLPTSTLRDACARARSSAYSPRLQFRALELCVSVSLDRLHSAKNKKTLGDEYPPISNSLMAAIKRSQANQRRHPETFHLYQMHQLHQQRMHQEQMYNSQSQISCVKVELKHFILSILDDPIVSRVFGDAGFRSSDIKLSILHPPNFHNSLIFPQMFPGSNTNNNNSIRTGFNFPFAVDQGEEDFKRIGQILATKKNPLLIGVSADSVLTGFTESLKNGKTRFLPSEIEGLEVVDIGDDIRKFVDSSEEMMSLKVKEVSEKVERCTSCGVVVNFGDLKVFLEGESMGNMVSELGNLVRVYGGKLRLIGSVSSYENYMKIVAKFKDLEKDWDLNLVPITCSKLSTTNGSSQFKSSLMGSFVPFGGFFPVSTEMENSSSKRDQSSTRCGLCNEKYEHEVSVVLKGGKTLSVGDQQSAGLASWMHNPESDTNTVNNVLEAKDHNGIYHARVIGLQRKWNDICHRLHHNPQPPQNSSQIRARIPYPHHFPPNTKMPEINVFSNQDTISRNRSPPVDFFKSTSSSPTTSITTYLGLGPIYVSPEFDHQKPQDHEARLSIRGAGSIDNNETSKYTSNDITKSYEKDFKQLYRAIVEKVGYQNETIRAVCQTVIRVKTGHERRHVWFMFSGCDRVGKRKISAALAEVVFGSRECLISMDLNFENQISHPGSIFDRQSVDFSDPLFRGKTIIDFIAEELVKKPRSVVLLEHIDKADFLTQDSLSRAIKTGKILDSRGRETRITDAVFITTISSKDSKEPDDLNYSEERILNAKRVQMRISVDINEPASSSVLISPKDLILRNPENSKKRKRVEIDDFEITVPKVKKVKSCFDLNLPLEETEEIDDDNDNDNDTKETWLDEFVEQVDQKVVFEPFDFDSRAETILKQISKCFQKAFGTTVVLEIENEVMVQILASYWLSDRKDGVEKWIDNVLYNGFMEVREKKRVGSESVVKIVAVEGVRIEDNDVSCVCLPSRIVVK